MLRKILLASAACAALSLPAAAEEVKIGVLLGFTGPLESITPAMASGIELAIKEANDSKAFLGGSTVVGVKADDTCGDAAAGVAAATRIITADKVNAIVGGHCSGVTGAVLQGVARPNGVVMISPSATSPSLTKAEDDGLFFRTAPSDARQGEVVAKVLMDKGFKSAAITFTNNDYGKGLAESIAAAYTKLGGKVTISAPHEDGKADYSAEVAALSSAGGDILVVAGYVDQGGKGIIQGAVDAGSFSKFFLPDGMFGEGLIKAIGKPLEGALGSMSGNESDGAKAFAEMAKKAGFKPDVYVGESYDAAALILLSMQAAKSSKSADFKGKVMEVANGPGEKILPGEIAKGLKLIAEGKPVNYEGASSVNLVGPGESAGSYRIYVIKGGEYVTDSFQ